MTYNGLRTAYSCGSDGSSELSSARANCKLEEDLHVRHSHLSGSEKVQPILVGVNTRQRLQARVVQHHSVYCLVTSAPDLRSSVQTEH